MRPRLSVCLVVFVAAGAVTAPVSAQSDNRLYVGALVGRSSTAADHVAGALTSVGITGGLRVLPWLDIEVDLLHPAGHLSREYTGRSVSLTGPGPPEQFVLTRFINERRADIVFGAGVVFHPVLPVRRLTPRFFAGVSNHRVRDRTVLEHLYLPPGVTIEQVNRALPQGDWRTRNLGGPSVGASLRIDLTPHLSVAPDIRYDYGSIGDEINNMLRSSIRMCLSF